MFCSVIRETRLTRGCQTKNGFMYQLNIRCNGTDGRFFRRNIMRYQKLCVNGTTGHQPDDMVVWHFVKLSQWRRFAYISHGRTPEKTHRTVVWNRNGPSPSGDGHLVKISKSRTSGNGDFRSRRSEFKTLSFRVKTRTVHRSYTENEYRLDRMSAPAQPMAKWKTDGAEYASSGTRGSHNTFNDQFLQAVSHWKQQNIEWWIQLF